MARYNEILVGRYNRFLQKLLGLKGGPPSPQLASEITSGFVLFNGVENRNLEGWDKFGGSFQQPAVGAQNSCARIRNPAASNIIAVIEKILVTSSLADTNLLFEQGPITTDLVAAVFTFSRWDARGRPNASAVISGGNNVGGLGSTKLEAALAPNTNYEPIVTDNQEMPLLPGDAIQVRTTAVNTLLQFSIWWRERFLEEGERT
jgi:hypothetical protein